MNSKENLDTPPTCGTCRHFTVNPDTTPFTPPAATTPPNK